MYSFNLTRSLGQTNMVSYAACWFNPQSLFLFTRIRVESTSVWLNETKNNYEEKQKPKHDPGTCRS
jgi:hypothetical protein